MDTMLRLFFAVNFNEKDLFVELLNKSKELFDNQDKIKWVEENNLHLTIFFIGEVNETFAKQLISDCDIQFTTLPTITLQYDSNFVFYHKKHPRVFGIRFKEDEALTKLKTKTNKLLEKYGITDEERTFIPHLTFGRVKEAKKLENFTKFEQHAFDFKTASISSFVLFQSTLTSSGPIYKPLWEIKL